MFDFVPIFLAPLRRGNAARSSLPTRRRRRTFPPSQAPAGQIPSPSPPPRRRQVVTAYVLTAPGRVSARQRTLLYLEPRDQLYFSARGRAVAAYDYELQLERVAVEGATACVETPKQVTQCI